MDPFRPDWQTVRVYAIEKGISMSKARTRLVRIAMSEAAEKAETVQELKALVRVLVSLAVLGDR